jgi:hypothetical protein
MSAPSLVQPDSEHEASIPCASCSPLFDAGQLDVRCRGGSDGDETCGASFGCCDAKRVSRVMPKKLTIIGIIE